MQLPVLLPSTSVRQFEVIGSCEDDADLAASVLS